MDRTELKIRRPNGQIEVVVKDFGFTAAMFATAKDANLKAGRGELLSYEVIKTEATPAPAPTAAQRARAGVTAAFDRAENLRDYPGQYFPALGRAKTALETWRRDYPEAALAEHQDRLRSQAADLRRKAGDALHFSADGSYGPAERQAAYDQMIAEADALEAQAARS